MELLGLRIYPTKVPMSRVQSIERAFAVLGALADGPIGVTEVADRADLPKSTAARLLASLAREGVVEQVPGDSRYRLGPRLVTLAAGIRPARSLAALARPSLATLAGSAGEAAGLSVRDGDQVHYIEQVGSPNPVSVRDWTGSRIPLHAVSSGQVLLAFSPPTSVQRYVGRPMERFTERTLVTADALFERMRAIRRDGYTWALEEFDEGISSVAAPVADASGEVIAAVHLHGPSYRFPSTGSEVALADEVVATAARISGSLRQAG
jgi:DNA-binding IclR family transcriptional regulator